MKMTKIEIEYYEAGIKDANEARSIVPACKSRRYVNLCNKYPMEIGEESLRCLKAYDNGVAFEICRQTKLEF